MKVPLQPLALLARCHYVLRIPPSPANLPLLFPLTSHLLPLTSSPSSSCYITFTLETLTADKAFSHSFHAIIQLPMKLGVEILFDTAAKHLTLIPLLVLSAR
ncbi:hypothetical protein BDW75DRAFT_150426 [Aspergillus navahoensis]